MSIKIHPPQSGPSVFLHIRPWVRPPLSPPSTLWASSSSLLSHSRSLSSEEDHKYDEEHDENEEYLDQKPAVGGDRLEVFEDLGVGHFNI